MRIETRYNLGDVVWHLSTRHVARKVKCPLCNGTAEVTIGDTDRTTYCPDCRYGVITTKDKVLTGEIRRLTVGQIRTEITNTGTKRDYMCEETGVGSGRVYPESDLYPSKADAERAAADAGATILNADREVLA